ncbi:hypothetical protein VTN02DRAFT_6707 [Thermoascus thermophilus]
MLIRGMISTGSQSSGGTRPGKAMLPGVTPSRVLRTPQREQGHDNAKDLQTTGLNPTSGSPRGGKGVEVVEVDAESIEDGRRDRRVPQADRPASTRASPRLVTVTLPRGARPAGRGTPGAPRIRLTACITPYAVRRRIAVRSCNSRLARMPRISFSQDLFLSRKVAYL